jgi:serine/threonine-protein kinase
MEALGLQAVTEIRRLEDVDPEQDGKVIETNPAAGQVVERGSRVTLFVAQGPATVEVPDLEGKTLSQAERELGEAGLKLGRATRVFSEDVPNGRIVSQNPSAGIPVGPGTTVTVDVSRGRETTTTPPTTAPPPTDTTAPPPTDTTQPPTSS